MLQDVFAVIPLILTQIRFVYASFNETKTENSYDDDCLLARWHPQL